MKRSSVMIWFGASISLLFLLFVLRKIDFDQLLEALSSLQPGYLVAAVLLTFVSYWLRAVRWRYLLIHERSLPVGSLYPAVIIGYMANNLFPARLGEFIRAWFLAEREQMKSASVFASLVIDRLFDGLSVMVILALVLFNLRLPSGMEQTTAILKTGGITTLLFYGFVLFFLLLLKRRPMSTLGLLAKLMKPFPTFFSEKVITISGAFLHGFKLSGNYKHLMMILFSSAFIWISATVPIHFILLGFGIHLPLTDSFFIMVLLVFAVMLPAAPGYIGTYHLACYTGLVAFNIQPTQAAAISLVIHGVGFFPVIIAGFYHLWSGGISLSQVRQRAAMEHDKS